MVENLQEKFQIIWGQYFSFQVRTFVVLVQTHCAILASQKKSAEMVFAERDGKDRQI
ncbi:MAG: hypothetical protein LBU43_02540 [Candidatus Accumulibacter sp.]|jgi:hypothetical protein|nr:hypothetical protein [Accumulibacter sp.]